MSTIRDAMSIFEKLTTKHRFADGAKMSVLHRYALRLEMNGRSVDVGFEQALEPGVDRLIHEGSILRWIGPEGETDITSAERAAILARVELYCQVKGFSYRIVRVP